MKDPNKEREEETKKSNREFLLRQSTDQNLAFLREVFMKKAQSQLELLSQSTTFFRDHVRSAVGDKFYKEIMREMKSERGPVDSDMDLKIDDEEVRDLMGEMSETLEIGINACKEIEEIIKENNK